MMGKKSSQKTIQDADYICSQVVPKDSFYHNLFLLGPALFRDEDFSEMYCDNNGRKSLPPSLMAKVLLLQEYENVSDRKAAENVKYNIAWKHALEVPLVYEGFDHSSICKFRARLMVHELEEKPFRKLCKAAKELDLIDPGNLHAVDSSAIIGHAQQQDSYTLIEEAIKKSVNAILSTENKETAEAVKNGGLTEYCDYQRPDIDWDKEKEKREYLKKLVQDAHQVLDLVTDKEDEKIKKDTELLRDILNQDIVYEEDNDDNSDSEGSNDKKEKQNSDKKDPDIRDGVAKDRIISTVDTEMRHGRKSSSQKFNGFKGHITIDTKTEWITNLTVSSANQRDSETGVSTVTGQKDHTGYLPEEVVADSGYVTADTRAEFSETEIKLTSPVRKQGRKKYYHKYDFDIDLENMEVTCPAGVTTDKAYNSKDNKGRKIKVFHFESCDDCEQRKNCTTAKKGRTITLLYHEKEALKALKRQREDGDFEKTYYKRYIIERKIAELFFGHGMRRARFFGKRKIKFQMLWKALAVNFKRLPKLLDKAPEVCLKKVKEVLRTENNEKKAAEPAV